MSSEARFSQVKDIIILLVISYVLRSEIFSSEGHNYFTGYLLCPQKRQRSDQRRLAHLFPGRISREIDVFISSGHSVSTDATELRLIRSPCCLLTLRS